MTSVSTPLNILLCEHSLADAELILEALRYRQPSSRIHHVRDSEDAMKYLHHAPPYSDLGLPDVVILNPALPRNSNHSVLDELQTNSALGKIQVVVFADEPIDQSLVEGFRHSGIGYFVKPVELDEFFVMIRQMQELWTR